LDTPQKGVHAALADIQEKTALLPDYGFKAKKTEQPAGAPKSVSEVNTGKTTVSGLVGGSLTLLAVMIGIFNPLMDRDILVSLGGIGISGGWVSFMSILMRFVLTVGIALTLIAVTGFNAVCIALDKLGTPRVFVVQLVFLYRYMFVLLDEAARMVRARSLRTFEGGGSGIKAYGPLVGQLLLRTMDRAQRVYLAMCCRGFDGEIRILKRLRFGPMEIGFTVGWSALFFLMRVYNVPAAMGSVIMGFFK
jgi:cobalt/nickel transport system permease protein